MALDADTPGRSRAFHLARARVESALATARQAHGQGLNGIARTMIAEARRGMDAAWRVSHGPFEEDSLRAVERMIADLEAELT